MHAHSRPIQNAAAAVANWWRYIAGHFTGETAGNVLPANPGNILPGTLPALTITGSSLPAIAGKSLPVKKPAMRIIYR